MLRINQFNIEPGIYRDHQGIPIVVTEIVTHTDNGHGPIEIDPIIVFRELEPKVEKYKTTGMPLSRFITIYKKEK